MLEFASERDEWVNVKTRNGKNNAYMNEWINE